MADVLWSHSPCSVPVGFHLSPLHPRLMDLPLLLISPIQYTVTKQGPLFHARDVEYWQLSVNWGVNRALLVWLFVGRHWFWWCISATCLPALVRIIIITVTVSASLLSFGPASHSHHSYWGRHHHVHHLWVFFLAALVPSASSGPSSLVESSSP